MTTGPDAGVAPSFPNGVSLIVKGTQRLCRLETQRRNYL